MRRQAIDSKHRAKRREPRAEESAADFVSLVRRYVAVIDNADDSTAVVDLLSASATLLPQIYAAGQGLPDVEPESGPSRHWPQVERPEKKLESILANENLYFEIFDPFDKKSQVSTTLSNDLSDVYLDLKHPLMTFDDGHIAEAIWQWKLNLQHHCGDHLVGAMKPIHWLIKKHLD